MGTVLQSGFAAMSMVCRAPAPFPQIRLALTPARTRAGEMDDRALPAHIGRGRIHDDRRIGTDRHPFSYRHDPSERPGGNRQRLRIYGMIELPIVENLAPEAVIDEVADVLDEPAEHVLADRRAGLRGVHGGRYGRLRRGPGDASGKSRRHAEHQRAFKGASARDFESLPACHRSPRAILFRFEQGDGTRYLSEL
jgi:hypothetical protein